MRWGGGITIDGLRMETMEAFESWDCEAKGIVLVVFVDVKSGSGQARGAVERRGEPFLSRMTPKDRAICDLRWPIAPVGTLVVPPVRVCHAKCTPPPPSPGIHASWMQELQLPATPGQTLNNQIMAVPFAVLSPAETNGKHSIGYKYQPF